MGIAFTSITLNTPNLENMVRFYEILGCQFTKIPVSLGGDLFRATLNGLELCLMSAKSAEKVLRPTVMIAYQIDQLDEKIQKLQAIPGVIVLMEPSDLVGGRRAIVQDPDGQSVELFS